MTKAEKETLCNIKERLRDLPEELDNLKERLRNLLEELDNLKYSGKRWKPKMGEKYYYIVDLGAVCAGSWYGNDFHKKLYAAGNVFPSEEVAIFEAERRRVVAELSDFAEGDDAVWDGEQRHWCVWWDITAKKLMVSYSLYAKHAGIHFPSEEAVYAAIEAVGEERVKKYYFGVKE